jgi:dihydrofolate reductase
LEISIIAAIAQNYGIGLNNQLLWHLPDDLQFFKKVTLNNAIVMGRKTYESIGKALPKRQNIVVSSNINFVAPGCVVVQNLQEAIKCATSNEVFIVGGATIYAQSMSIAHKMYITHVHHTCEADTFFPKIDDAIWKEVARENHFKDEKHAYDFSFVTYEKTNTNDKA